jgi:hypothetical protein
MIEKKPYHHLLSLMIYGGRALHNLTIFLLRIERVKFSEVTGERALSFRNVSAGGNRRPRFIGATRMRQNSPIDTLLKKPTRKPWN